MTHKIVVNGRCFTRRITGVERYAHEISKRIQPKPRLIVPGQALNQVSGHLWEQFLLPTKVRGDEVLWSPANSGPWMIRRQVVTIHDASVFDHPEWFRLSFAAWTRLSWKILGMVTKAIVTDSSFSRERLQSHLGVPKDKIKVISNGVAKPFEQQTSKQIGAIRTKYDLNQPYLLFVGTHEPRKNLQTLLTSWQIAQDTLREHSLVVAGDAGRVFTNKGFNKTPKRTRLLGYIPDPDLPALYAGANMVIVPSIYEGFGLTALEAMACGTPVIASNTASFPEVTGEAALLVNPNNPKEIVNAMYKIAEDRSFANSLRARGLQRAAQFSWDESTRQVESLLRDP